MRLRSVCVVLTVLAAACGPGATTPTATDRPNELRPASDDATTVGLPTTTTSTSAPAAPATAPVTSQPSASVTPATATTPSTAGSTPSTAVAPTEPGVVIVARGDHGPDVEALQHALRRHGYTIEADGWFGPATEGAVRGFQQSHGLEVDGIAGPRTWDSLSRSNDRSTIILRDDGLGVVSFGDAERDVTPRVTEVLGPPDAEFDDTILYPCDEDWCEGEARTVRWQASGGAGFVLRFEQTIGDLVLVGWNVWGWGGRSGIELATPEGAALGTSASELLAMYPEADFGHTPVPYCGDMWWTPAQFRLTRIGDADVEHQIRGSVHGDWDGIGEALDAALIAHGIERGLDCRRDVMCADVFGEFQELVGLPSGCGLERETWLALGLPLPFDPSAPVDHLGAGEPGDEC